MNKITHLTQHSVADLLHIYTDVINELIARDVLRTTNNPVADYAEHLVTRALSLNRVTNSTKGYDATDSAGRKYEIKARRITKTSKPNRLSAIRELESDHFDYLVAVLFDEYFRIQKAVILPKKVVAKIAFWQKHVNAWIVPMNSKLWNASGAKDITSELIGVQ